MRSLDDLSVGAVLTQTTKSILDLQLQRLQIPGAQLLFGGEELENHSFPEVYGAVKPTTIFVPLKEIL